MAREAQIEKEIPSLYKMKALNLLLFGYVRGARSALHTLTINESILMFMDEFGLDHDDFNSDSALTTYERVQKELFEILKSKNNESKSSS